MHIDVITIEVREMTRDERLINSLVRVADAFREITAGAAQTAQALRVFIDVAPRLETTKPADR